MATDLLSLLNDIWTHIFDNITSYDTIMLITTSKSLHELCRKFAKNKPADDETMRYFASIGSISCLKYCHELGIEWDEYTIEAAAKNGHLETIQFLHVNGCDHDESACEEAAKNGHLLCLKYMHENGFSWDDRTTAAAAKANILEILKYLHDNGCPLSYRVFHESALYSIDCLKYVMAHLTAQHWNYVKFYRVRREICSEAASAGNLETLTYFHRHCRYLLSNCCSSAALSGSLECLKYAHEHGGEWDKRTIDYAALGGHTHCIKYAFENGATLHDESLNNNDKSINAAVGSGNIECVRYLASIGAQWPDCVYETAAAWNDLAMIKYLLEEAHRPVPKSNGACMACENVQVLKYLHKHGSSWEGVRYPSSVGNYDAPSNTMAYWTIQSQHGPRRRDLSFLKYILSCGYKLDTTDISLCDAAAETNNVEMLQFLISLGCKTHVSIMKTAAEMGALKVLKYLHNRGFELSNCLAVTAATKSQPEVLEYLLKHRYGFDSLVGLRAAREGSLYCLKIAHKYGVLWTENACLEAMRSDVYWTYRDQFKFRFKVMKFLHEHGCPWSHQECTLAAKDNDLKCSSTQSIIKGSQWSSETWGAAVDNDAKECLQYLLVNGCPTEHQQDTKAITVNEEN